MTSAVIAALRRRLPDRPLTRFAPSPTGYLHLGHVANAIYVWGLARALGGRVLLRLEDHDRGRCRSAYEAALLEDLAWLGFEPDLGRPEAFRAGPSIYRQSDNGNVYAVALEHLAASAHVYACDCSRKTIAAATAAAAGDAVNAPAAANDELWYPGRCRDRGLSWENSSAGDRGLRVQLDEGSERFEDPLTGPHEQHPARQCGDLLVRDRLGQWTYHFAVTVDDLRHGVDLVIRGEDLLASTGRQIRLARMLDRTAPPVFLHHPLLRHATGEKLSKANQDTGIRELRAAGVRPAVLLGEVAFHLGLQRESADLTVEDLATLFP